MQGLTIKSLKHHTALIPLFVCVGLGAGGAAFYLLRLALKSPEVSWARKSKPEPWEDYRNNQYKFYGTGADVPVSKAPKY